MLTNLALKTSYRTGTDDLSRDFYERCLRESVAYDRAVGYFRSSIFLITGPEIIAFAKRRGRMRLICSPSLTSADIEQIEKGYLDRQTAITNMLEADLQAITKDESYSYPLKVLSTLIKFGLLEIKIGIKASPSGIYHEKLGIFYDQNGEKISFIGSANETFNAWHPDANFESIEVFCSWKGGTETERVARHLVDFENLWSDRSTGLKVLPLPEALREKLVNIAENDFDDIDVERLKPKKPPNKPTKISALLPHQSQAIDAWERSGCQGIFEHATGSGKTVTALAVVDRYVSTGGFALILVPSQLLLKQWLKEIKQEISGAVYLLAGAGNTSWKKSERLRSFTSGSHGDAKRIVIATMQTASSSKFIDQLPRHGEFLVVADEVHQIGSPVNSSCLQINATKRLGLSATPKRYGDAEGTKKVFDYFKGVVPPVISLYDAIQAKRLVEYEYFPKALNLTVPEAELWAKMSRELRREIAITNTHDKALILSARARQILINRSRIAKKATQKIDLGFSVIAENYKPGQHWLVYCEDKHQLSQVRERVKSLSIPLLEYYSEMEGDAEKTLNYFEWHGGVMLSIRCLDEGIDIPCISHALILASSQNPRQFIQRRGRVLRRHESKTFATIYDAIVVPVSLEEEPDQLSLLKSELIRAWEFAQHSVNKLSSMELSHIAIRLGISLDKLIDDGFEEEAEGVIDE